MDEAGSCASGGGFRPGVDSLDEPPNSRIFLVISKYTPESVLRERFSPFGEIQDIWVVRDKHTKESKGIAFVKFARSSQACRAMEEMHGQCLSPNDTKPIKVLVPGLGSPRKWVGVVPPAPEAVSAWGRSNTSAPWSGLGSTWSSGGGRMAFATGVRGSGGAGRATARTGAAELQ